MKKVLFIASHRPNRAPGQRFRFEQYFDFLAHNGVECHLSYLLSESDDRLFYKQGNFLDKLKIIRSSTVKRKRDLEKLSSYDAVFIFREALMTRSLRFEKAFKKSGLKIIYDFDDAIWIPNVSEANKLFSFAKNPAKTSKIIAMSDVVVAGNEYLKQYALQFNDNVIVIPTTIDTESYKPTHRKSTEVFTIGWSGSITTIQHFEYALPVLRKIKAKYGDRVRIKVIGDANYFNAELGINGVAWTEPSEIEELSQFDAGIMPLPNDEWAKGKCGLKGLQYMALGIPTIMSPVGVNADIIQHGVNGFLADNESEWIDALELLISNADLRKSVGEAGRITVEEKYSVNANKNSYLKLFT